MPEFTAAERHVIMTALGVVIDESRKELRFWDARAAEDVPTAQAIADEERARISAARSALKKVGG